MAVCHFVSCTASSKLIFSAFARRHTRCTSFVESYKSRKLRILGCRGSSSSSEIFESVGALVGVATDDSPTSILTSVELFQSHSLASFTHTSRLTITILLIRSISLYTFVFSSYPIKFVSFFLLIISNKDIPFAFVIELRSSLIRYVSISHTTEHFEMRDCRLFVRSKPLVVFDHLTSHVGIDSVRRWHIAWLLPKIHSTSFCS